VLASHVEVDELPEGHEQVSWLLENLHTLGIYLHEYLHLEMPVAKLLQTRSLGEIRLLDPTSTPLRDCLFPMASEWVLQVQCQIVGTWMNDVDRWHGSTGPCDVLVVREVDGTARGEKFSVFHFLAMRRYHRIVFPPRDRTTLPDSAVARILRAQFERDGSEISDPVHSAFGDLHCLVHEHDPDSIVRGVVSTDKAVSEIEFVNSADFFYSPPPAFPSP
jgi:hypothetical protein